MSRDEVICPGCRAQNPDTANFCTACGSSLGASAAVACPRCRAPLAPSARFCSVCGHAVDAWAPDARAGGVDALRRLMPEQYVEQLLAAKGRASRERRIVTVLFSDVSGSTALGEHLDPEDVLTVMNGAFELLIRPIYKYEGTLARLMGDAILAFFGAPIAHEDDAVRACRAALEIVDGARAYAEQLRRERRIEDFNVRVGINTGLVVVGEVGADMRVEYTAMGDAVNLAARMENAAAPGTVLVSGDTRALVAHAFDTEHVATIEVKGRVQPVTTYRVTAFTAAAQARDDRHRRRSPLEGRQAELRRVADALTALAQGRGARLAIVGESGLGKSRLLFEARAQGPPGLTWAEGRALPHTQTMTYALIRSALGRLAGLGAGNGEPGEALGRRIAKLFGTHSSAVLPFLARVLEVPLAGEPDRFVARLEGERLHACLTQACVALVRQSVESGPLVLVFDDLQWADSASARVVEALATLPDSVPVLLLLVLRPEEGPGWSLHQTLRQHYHDRYDTISLEALDREAARRMLAGLSGGGEVPERIERTVLDRADGVPFFIEELWRALFEAGITKAAGAGTLHGDVPQSLQEALQARLDRLPVQSRRVLQAASVIGRVFQDGLLAAMFEAAGDGALGASLDELVARDFIRPCAPDAGGRDPLGASYAFRQVVTQEVTYNTLLAEDRRALHRRIGEQIETRCPSRLDELAPVLATHFERAGLDDRAVHYLIRAGRRAAGVHAMEEARHAFERAEARTRTVELEAADRLALHEGLGDVRARQGQYKVARDHYLAALANGPAPLHRVRLFRKLGQLYDTWGHHAEATASFNTALAEMAKDLDLVQLAGVYSGLAMVACRQERLDEALELAQLALVLCEGEQDDVGIADACNILGVIHARKESPAAALANHARSLEIRERLGELYGQAATHNNLGLALSGQRRWKEAAAHFGRSLELFEQVGNRHGVARAADNLGRALRARGDDEQGKRYRSRAAAILSEAEMSGAEWVTGMWDIGVW